MDLNELKDLWNKEDIQETPEVSLEKQNEIHSPLEKIRKNMRIEFWYTILSYPMLAVIIYYFAQGMEQWKMIVALLVISVAIAIYYFMKFNTLYQKINTQNFSTFHQLLNLRYELVLNTELYKSYYISYIPIIFCAYFIIYGVRDETISHFIFIMSITLAASISMYFLGKLWLREFYGKYIIEISDLVMQLTDEKDDFVYDRKSLQSEVKFKPFMKTRNFFERKFGNSGLWYNYIFWFFLGFMVLVTLAFIAGFTLGYLGVMMSN